jgi:hypothetical protein
MEGRDIIRVITRHLMEGRTETQALGWFVIIQTRSVYLQNTGTLKKATNPSQSSSIPQISTGP